MVLVKDNTINDVEVFLKWVVHLEDLWELMSESGEARLNEGDQLGHILVTYGCQLDSVPCDNHGMQC